MEWTEGQKVRIRFHRQKPLGENVVDFYCADLDLIIEIDGVSHTDKYDEDQKRQKILEEFDLSFLWYDDTEVKNNIGSVVENIKEWIKEHTPPTKVGFPSQEGNLNSD